MNNCLKISSTSNPADTIVLAANPINPVFNVTADYVNLSGFTVIGGSTGICLWDSNNISISYNNCSNNKIGIPLSDSSNNIIYRNNYINNANNRYSINSSNIWNSTEKITYLLNGTTYESYLGNYWDDYEEKYPDAEAIDTTGIWDTPYSIDEDVENYPLMRRFENYISPC